jgi:hypothetical protein
MTEAKNEPTDILAHPREQDAPIRASQLALGDARSVRI